jgi:hypothetical protein
VARTDVIVRAGPPIDLSDFRSDFRRRPVAGPLLREVTDWVLDRVRDLFDLAEVRQEQAS